MFGSSNPFGQSSNSSFGSPSVFGQTNNAAGSNPFAPKPFGSPNPFGAQQMGSSMFGTSTGVFGQPSTPAFGASPTPAFGASPSFGASSTPAFGSSSSSFGSSAFGQKPTFGGFGSTPTQPSPFGSTFQQTQPAFGSNLFGSTTPFGASSQPAFGATSSPAFGATSTPAFGASSTPTFGASSTPAFGASSTPAFGATSTPAFGATSTPTFGSTTTPAFGSTSTPLFGNTGSAFGVSSTPTFGSTSTSAFGAPNSSLFGSSSTPAFGASSAPAFGSSTTAFGASSSPSFSFGSTPSFGQSASTFGSTPFGTTPSAFGTQSSPFGAQTTTPTFGSPGFGQSAFGSQQGGSRVVPYSATPETETTGGQPAGKLESISAMPAYKEKSHEELRWEDYQRGDKGGPNPSGQPAGGISFPTQTQTNPFGSTGTFGQPAANPFSAASSSNPFATKTPAFGATGFGSSSTSLFSSSFGASSSSPFGSTSTSTSPFGAPSNPGFGSNSTPSFFGGTTSAFSSSPSMFGSSMAGSTSSFGSGLTFGNTQSSGLFQSSTPSLGQTPSPFGQPTGFQQTNPAFGSNLFSTPSTGFGGSLFSSSAPSMTPSSTHMGFGQTTPSLSTPFASQTSNAFSFNNFGQTQQAPSSGFGGISTFNQGTFGQSLAPQSNMVMQPAPVTNPFGTLPAMPQMSIGRVGSAPSVQYGISSMPVSEKPIPVRISSLVTPRHMSQRRIRLPARKYHPKVDGQRVPFFSDEESSTATPKADALFMPRENPRALIIRPIEQWPLRATVEKQSTVKDDHSPANGNGNLSEPSAPAQNGMLGNQDERPRENGHSTEQDNTAPSPSINRNIQKTNGMTQDNHAQRETDSSYIPISGHRAGEAAIVYEHGAGIEALMPKLRHADYYTEPRIQELAAKERADPGFCRRVKDFVVGRHGYGSIKFLGETDVRRLDLESVVQFNNREVIVYKDEGKKPPVGQGLNKAAEVTLLNIKCMNKKTGQQYTEGPKVERYKEMLIKKTEEQGAEFILYDAVNGEWKFRVKHFSSYELGDGEFDDLEVECYERGGGGDTDSSSNDNNSLLVLHMLFV
ncbi:nuclear pore complex protein NUP98A isoform X2 [Iris pallida]|uniref:Nucleoporin autopeptidase n=1 Tax=Iris pallida TaxID=29817 RepID=A0AAX6GW20_IRIPA|nr:nuclear pore complex protein NUP98A isoform X2 [Iris pallida]